MGGSGKERCKRQLESTMSRSSDLNELQLIDSQQDQHRNRLKEIRAILVDNAEIKRVEANLKRGDNALEAAQKDLRAAEQKVKDQRLKIQQTNAKLYGGKIRNPKELQDLQEEGEALKRFLTVLEDRQLECMLEVDDKKELRNTAQEEFNTALRSAENLHAELDMEKSKIEKENQVLENKRQNQIQFIPADDLAIYERLRKQRFGVAVSMVKDRACSACGATLTAALHQIARSPSQITYCETCNRILCAN